MVSPLKRLVLVPFFVSAAVFSTLTLPLALIGSKPVDIRLQEEPFFDGRLRDVATPYLGLASALSLGAGVASVAVMGWRQSSLKSVQFEKQLAGLQQHLKEKEELLEELKLTESRLETSGLSMFLDAETQNRDTTQHLSAKKTAIEAEPLLVETPIQVVTQPVEVLRTNISEQTVEPNRKARTAASAFQSAQNFLSFERAIGRDPAAIATTASTPASLPVEELQSQIEQLMAQISTLQNSLQTTSQSDTPDAVRVNPRHQAQVLESWLMHRVTS